MKTAAKTHRPGLHSLGIGAEDSLGLVRRVRAGLPFAHMAKFQKATTLPWEKITHFVAIPQRTLTRRQAEGRLHADESDRLLQASTLFEMAVRLFGGDIPAAVEWLQAPQRALGGEIPLEFASTAVGAREVEHLILRLEHGVFS